MLHKKLFLRVRKLFGAFPGGDCKNHLRLDCFEMLYFEAVAVLPQCDDRLCEVDVTKASVFSVQMSTLNQEVSELTKGLHHVMHLLQAHISMHHYKASYPYGVQVMSSPPTGPNTGVPLNPASAYHLHNDPGSHEGHSHPTVHSTEHWSYSGSAETQTESHHRPKSSSPPANPCPTLSLNSEPRPGLCHSSESTKAHLWASSSLLGISPGFHGGNPGLTSHAWHEDSDNRPLSASPTTISKSQPTLCLQPPSGSDEYSCLLSSAHTGLSTRSLLDSSPSSYPSFCLPSESHLNLTHTSNEDIRVPTSHNLLQDTSIFQIDDSHPTVQPVPTSMPTLPSNPLGSPLASGSPRSDALEPHLPLGDPSAIEHTSLECLLGKGGSMESRDSESASSRRSSIGVQTQSTEQSWCLDLTD